MARKKLTRKERIHLRIRKRVSGTAERPRLSVFRSNKDIYCQLIDDRKGYTLAAADSRGLGSGSKVEQAASIGKTIGEKAKSLGIDQVVFDRSGYLYHGRVKALADGAREAGLQF